MRILIAVDEKGFADLIDECISRYDLSAQDYFKVVHVIPTESGVAEYLQAHSEVAEQIHIDSLMCARGLVRSTALKLRSRFHNTHVSEQICEGLPAETIIKIAKLWPADLIIVGCHGKSELGKFFLGSVSSKIIASAPCTTLVLRSGAPDIDPKLTAAIR